jgi:hypothetical protein
VQEFCCVVIWVWTLQAAGCRLQKRASVCSIKICVKMSVDTAVFVTGILILNSKPESHSRSGDLGMD